MMLKQKNYGGAFRLNGTSFIALIGFDSNNPERVCKETRHKFAIEEGRYVSY
jgi:hypothetical protein